MYLIGGMFLSLTQMESAGNKQNKPDISVYRGILLMGRLVGKVGWAINFSLAHSLSADHVGYLTNLLPLGSPAVP